MTTDSSLPVLGFLAVALAFLVATSGVVTLQVEAPAPSEGPALPAAPALPAVPTGVPLFDGSALEPVAGASAASEPAALSPADTPASAGAAGTDSVTGLDPASAARAEAYVERYNRGVDAAPDHIRERYADDVRGAVVALSAYETVRRQVADEVVRFEVRTDTGEEAVVTVRTDADAHVVDYRVGDGSTPPTVVVRTDEATLREVAGADDRLTAALDAVATGDVEVSGSGVDPVVLKNVVEWYRADA